MTDFLTISTAILDGYQRQMNRARARADEVTLNPDAQQWEVEQARDSLETAQRALDVHTAAYAVAGMS